MTLRTEHPSSVTPELADLAELVYLVALLQEGEGFRRTIGNKVAFAAFDHVIEHAKQLVAERLAIRARLPADEGPVTAHAQLSMALNVYSQARHA